MSKVVSGHLSAVGHINKKEAKREFGTAKADGFVHAVIMRQTKQSTLSGTNIKSNTIHCAMSQDLYDYCISKINRSSLGILKNFDHGEAYELKSGILSKSPSKIS
jgi:hypothetical protein